MNEFIYNCYLWVANNYKEITMTLTSAQFISLISAIALIIKSMKKTDANTTSTEALTSKLKENDNSNKTVVDIKNELGNLKNENARLKNDITEFKNETLNSVDVITAKLDAMLEVQSIVYSTIKNDAVRETVSTIVANAKYAETQTRAKLKEEVEDLKNKITEKFDNVMEDVEKTVKVVNAAVSDKKDDTIMRY